MEHLEAMCKYYQAVTLQTPALFPTLLSRPAASLQQEQELSRLFCSLALMESGVRTQQGTATKGEKAAYVHIMPALVFLNTYPTVSKPKVQYLCMSVMYHGENCC